MKLGYSMFDKHRIDVPGIDHGRALAAGAVGFGAVEFWVDWRRRR